MNIGPSVGPIRNVERRRFQRQSYKLLGELLRRHPDLPTISWTVSTFSLIGHCVDPDPQRRRLAFDAWVDALGLERWRILDDASLTDLHARRRNYLGRGVDVVVTTAITYATL